MFVTLNFHASFSNPKENTPEINANVEKVFFKSPLWGLSEMRVYLQASFIRNRF